MTAAAPAGSSAVSPLTDRKSWLPTGRYRILEAFSMATTRLRSLDPARRDELAEMVQRHPVVPGPQRQVHQASSRP